MAITQRRMTLDEFLALPEIDEKPYLEFFDGMVTEKVSPTHAHGWLGHQLANFTNNVAVPRKLAIAIPEVRTTFAGASPVPDVAVHRWERAPFDADGDLADRGDVRPDIAVEIASPGQRVPKLKERCRWYVANGVSLSLLIQRRDRSVTAFRPDGELTLRGEDRIDLSPVLPDFDLTVQALFDTLRLG